MSAKFASIEQECLENLIQGKFHIIKNGRRPRIFVKLSFRKLRDSKFTSF